MTLYLTLLLAFVGTRILLAASPIREGLVARLGERGFQGLYSVVALALLFGAIHVRGAVEPEPLWVAPVGIWHLAPLLMLVAAILLVGSLTPANKALPGVPQTGAPPSGVLRITRHPMMWAFAIWACVHALVSGELRVVLLACAIGFLALAGAAHQDVKKRRLLGDGWAIYEAQTSYWPLGAQLSGRQPWRALWPGLVPVLGGILLFLLMTFLHPMLLNAPVVPPWGFLGR
ncbi:NnrU family protein [Sandaracinobacteroides hominis]|uniref:NnrU family protein n=1 Tax=Sandaracinobacteroides hominis TaxID=2780086 RepID=UPI0018F6E15E|nr:NnrU family protein [Sandaracinobacteroides hominis]